MERKGIPSDKLRNLIVDYQVKDPAPERLCGEVQETPKEYTLENWEARSEEEKVGLRIVEILQSAGEAYFVGGYTRDLVMSQNSEQYSDFEFDPHDIDIVTSLEYSEAEKLLKSQLEIPDNSFTEAGENFLVLHVNVPIDDERSVKFEVATFRSDEDYDLDMKGKTKVAQTSDIREDAARRDFTINAMYFDPIKKVIKDYVGGYEDIRSKTLRTVGDPYERLIEEDRLRLLRDVRFMTKYSMHFDRDKADIIKTFAAAIHREPAERIKEEMDKILRLPRAAFAINYMARVGLLQEILPEVSDLLEVRHTPEGVSASVHKEGSVYRHQLEVMRSTQRPEFVAKVREKFELPDSLKDHKVIEIFYKRYSYDNEKYGPMFAWAELLHDVGKKTTQEFKPVEDTRPERYTFYGHEHHSLDVAKDIVNRSRLTFSGNEKHELFFLIGKHMWVHNIVDKGGQVHMTRKTKELFRNPYIEQLLFLGLADELGNYSDGKDVEQKIARFDAVWNALQGFRQKEKEEAELLAKLGPIRKRIREQLIVENRLEMKKVGYIIDPIQDAIRILLDEEKIAIEDIDDVLSTVNKLLDAEGERIGYDKKTFPGERVAEVKEAIYRLVLKYYDVTIEQSDKIDEN